jgi:hypothetical protein
METLGFHSHFLGIRPGSNLVQVRAIPWIGTQTGRQCWLPAHFYLILTISLLLVCFFCLLLRQPGPGRVGEVLGLCSGHRGGALSDVMPLQWALPASSCVPKLRMCHRKTSLSFWHLLCVFHPKSRDLWTFSMPCPIQSRTSIMYFGTLKQNHTGFPHRGQCPKYETHRTLSPLGTQLEIVNPAACNVEASWPG